MTFGFGFGFPRMQGVGAFSPAALFAAGEVGAWYDPSDLTTLFQDTAGTTPVTAAGQTVALMLDKSRTQSFGGARRNLLLQTQSIHSFPTQWSTFNFASTASTITAAPDGTLTASLVTFGSIADSQVFQSFAVPNGLLTFSAWMRSTSGKSFRFKFSNGGGNTNLFSSDFTTTTSWQRFSWTATASSAINVSISNEAAGGVGAIEVWGFQLETGSTATAYQATGATYPTAWLGNHATQATAAQRPTYGIEPMTGRRNLILQSQSIQSSPWVGFFVSGASSTVVSPDGVSFAAAITGSGDTGTSWSQTYSSAPIATYTFSLWLIADSSFSTSITIGGTTLTVSVTTGWQRFSVTTTTASVANLTASFRPSINAGVVRTVYAWGAQLETGSTATAYQRVTTRFDVTEAGVASKSYVWFDGVDDGMTTADINFTATNKMAVFTGMRRLTDASLGIVFELSETNESNNGTFGLIAPTGGASKYQFNGRGTIVRSATTSTTVAPITNVVAGTIDIPEPSVKLRVNGSQVGQDLGSLGTGNFGNYPMFLGRRGGTFNFNGNIYSLIVRGAATDTATITSTETWVNQRTGAY